MLKSGDIVCVRCVSTQRQILDLVNILGDWQLVLPELPHLGDQLHVSATKMLNQD